MFSAISHELRPSATRLIAPDAIELSNANLLEFDKYVDYYEVLGVDQFASAGEIKAAHKKLSLEYHPLIPLDLEMPWFPEITMSALLELPRALPPAAPAILLR